MANVQHRPLASTSTASSSDKVRKLWKDFERTIPNGRNVMEHKVSAALVKAEAEYQKMPDKSRVPNEQHEEMKTNLSKKIRQAYYDGVVAQWHTKLSQAGLKAEDWSDITPEEMETVAQALGGGIDAHSDEDMVVVHPAVNPVPQTPFLAAYATSLNQRPIAPSFSTSTRTSNVSTVSTASSASSYAVVNPSEFHSEEEDDYFYSNIATSHETSGSEDEDGLPTTFIAPSRNNHFGGWSSSESSLHNSVDSLSNVPYTRPPVSNIIQNMPANSRPIPASKPASIAQTPNENIHASSFASTSSGASPKTKVRQTYIGPQLEDPNEPLSEADDFELFKMQTRMQKIVEFHREAALAEIRLFIEIYKDRKASASGGTGVLGLGDRKDVSARVIEHQKRMMQLQKEKEDERKTTVKAERAKRRSELRTGGRPGRSNTIVAPVPSAMVNPAWLTSFQESVSAQVETNFDFSKIISENPDEREGNVEQLLKNMFPNSDNASISYPTSVSSASNSRYNLNATRDGEEYDSDPASPYDSGQRWNPNSGMGVGMSSASASASNSNSSSRQPSRTQMQPQRYSSASAAAANVAAQSAMRKGKGKGRPSPFGEDSGSESDPSDDDDDDGTHGSPAGVSNAGATGLARSLNDELANQLHQDSVFAAAVAQYGGLGAGIGMGRTSNSSSPPMQWQPSNSNSLYEQQLQALMQQSQAQLQEQPVWGRAPSVQPQSSMWMPKEARATPVASGWTRKRTGSILSSDAPKASSSHSGTPLMSASDAFGSSQVDMYASASAAFGPHLGSSTSSFAPASSISTAGKGKKTMASSMLEQQQQERYAWEQDDQQTPSTKSFAAGIFSSSISNAKGKKPSVEPQQQQQQSIWNEPPKQQQSIWNEPPKKATPPSTAANSKQSIPTPAPAPAPAAAPAPSPPAPAAPPKVEKVAPAPAPAPPAKKMNKKQRQAAMKKGGAAAAAALAAAAAEEAEAEAAAAAAAQAEPEPEPEPAVVEPPPPPPQHQEPASLMSKMMPSMGMGRARKDSITSAFGWEDNVVTTPRPASKIPAHLQQHEAAGTPRPGLPKKFGTSDSASGLGMNASGTGTIKPSQWGASAGGSASNKSIFNLFGGSAAPSTASAGTRQSGMSSSLFGKGGARVPGGFDVEDDDGGGGGDDDGGGGEYEEEQEEVEEEEVSPQVQKGPAASVWGLKTGKASATAQQQQVPQQQPLSAAQRFRRMSSAQSSTPIVKVAAQAPPVPAPAPAPAPVAAPAQPAGKKGARAKKNAKGKKATVEDVPDEEVDNRGGSLPVDSSALLLPASPSPTKAAPSKVILEPKPSVAPRMYSSIIDYGDGEEGEGEEEDAYFSSFAATPSTAPSSPPDPFGGDDARLAAAIKELQEGTSKMSKLLGGGGAGGGSGGAWGISAGEKRQQPQLGHATWTPSVSEAEQNPSTFPFGSRSGAKATSTQQQTPVWGQIGSKDKGKNKATDSNEESMKGPVHNMKRNKPATGWL
ncbi:hypothetical protein JR316_0009856 [Psilocybe cubensis]|uniref:Uncharacterized protein n=2 Tax=Psilocybe cubensis TaxID=181762 RepID=A0ACB8GQ78_PSICU|nr:hypothetical protein JR316_0009856 [Psilocybe cubensis]KAH9477630.1 hypothetical protein JR316_0009856 [Psilocybe cubensis]